MSKETKETYEQWIKRMTLTAELFEPTGFISVQDYKHRNKKMLFIECYTDCIYKAGQPSAKFWISPTSAVHLAWQLLEHSKVWQGKRKPKKQEQESTPSGGKE